MQLLLFFRIDDYTAYFQTNNLTLKLHDKYSLLKQENIEILSDHFIYGGTKMGNMYLYGGTIGRTRYPTFIHRGIKKNLPRPVVKSRYGGPGKLLLETEWFQYLSQQAEKNVESYFSEVINTNCRFITLYQSLERCKLIVPNDLRINGTFFTSVSVIPSKNKDVNHVHLHMDRNDIISCVFFMGNDVDGGDSVFYDGKDSNNCNDYVHHEKFVHGKSITGEFSKILHGATIWKGFRLTIVFYTNKKIYNHFLTYGMHYYQNYKDMKHPSNFISLG